jgi:hypothetical protein
MHYADPALEEFQKKSQPAAPPLSLPPRASEAFYCTSIACADATATDARPDSTPVERLGYRCRTISMATRHLSRPETDPARIENEH